MKQLAHEIFEQEREKDRERGKEEETGFGRKIMFVLVI